MLEKSFTREGPASHYLTDGGRRKKRSTVGGEGEDSLVKTDIPFFPMYFPNFLLGFSLLCLLTRLFFFLVSARVFFVLKIENGARRQRDRNPCHERAIPKR